jgi:hypothetical protein
VVDWTRWHVATDNETLTVRKHDKRHNTRDVKHSP